MSALSHPHVAAMIAIGCNPFVSLILTFLVVGLIVWLALWLLGMAVFIAEPFRGFAMQAIKILGIVYVVLVALDIVFGIRLLAGVTPIGC